MKKSAFSIAIVLILVLVLISSCASTTTADTVQSDEETSNYIELPEWFDQQGEEGRHYVSVIGSSMSTPQITRQKALADARIQFAEYIKTTVEAITNTYAEGSNNPDDKTYAEKFANISNQRTQAIISGTRVENTAFDKDGNVYMRVSIPINTVEEELNTVADDVLIEDILADEELTEETSAEEVFAKNADAIEANARLKSQIAKYLRSSSSN